MFLERVIIYFVLNNIGTRNLFQLLLQFYSVVQYYVTSILVQILRNFVLWEHDFFTLTNRIIESQNYGIKDTYNFYGIGIAFLIYQLNYH